MPRLASLHSATKEHPARGKAILDNRSDQGTLRKGEVRSATLAPKTARARLASSGGAKG